MTYRGPTSFTALCDRADQRGARVELTIEPGRPLGKHGEEYRLLERIRVRLKDGKVAGERRIIANRVDEAARSLLAAI